MCFLFASSISSFGVTSHLLTVALASLLFKLLINSIGDLPWFHLFQHGCDFTHWAGWITTCWLTEAKVERIGWATVQISNKLWSTPLATWAELRIIIYAYRYLIIILPFFRKLQVQFTVSIWIFYSGIFPCNFLYIAFFSVLSNKFHSINFIFSSTVTFYIFFLLFFLFPLVSFILSLLFPLFVVLFLCPVLTPFVYFNGF